MTPSALKTCVVNPFPTRNNHTCDIPDSGYPDLCAFRIVEEIAKQREEILQLRLETLDDRFEDGEEDVDTDFTVYGLW